MNVLGAGEGVSRRIAIRQKQNNLTKKTDSLVIRVHICLSPSPPQGRRQAEMCGSMPLPCPAQSVRPAEVYPIILPTDTWDTCMRDTWHKLLYPSYMYPSLYPHTCVPTVSLPIYPPPSPDDWLTLISLPRLTKIQFHLWLTCFEEKTHENPKNSPNDNHSWNEYKFT